MILIFVILLCIVCPPLIPFFLLGYLGATWHAIVEWWERPPGPKKPRH